MVEPSIAHRTLNRLGSTWLERVVVLTPVVLLGIAGALQHWLYQGVDLGLLALTAATAGLLGWRALRAEPGPVGLVGFLLASAGAVVAAAVYPCPRWLWWPLLLASILLEVGWSLTTPRPGSRTTRKRRLALLAMLLSGSLVFAEIVGQVLCLIIIPARPEPITRWDPDLGWVFVGERMDGDVQLRFNSKHLRGPEVEGRPDLLLLGDSVTMGRAVSEEETFAGRLNAVNAGADGYSTYQERDRYLRDLHDLEARRVGLVVCTNDIVSAERSAADTRQLVRFNETIAGRSLVYSEAWFRLFVYRHNKRNQDDPQAATKAYLERVSVARDDKTWEDWTGAVRAIRDACTGEFFLVLSPPRVQVREWRKGTRSWWLNEAMARFARDAGIPFLDLLPALAGTDHDVDALYVDWVHFSALGHRLVADATREFLATR